MDVADPDVCTALNLEASKPSFWANFGYWPEAANYQQANQALARLLANSIRLNAEDRLLDIGIGCGEQLGVWKDEFSCRQIVGINKSGEQTALAGKNHPDVRLMTADANKIDSLELPLFDAVIAVDCAYHLARSQFLENLKGFLKPESRLAWCDLLAGPTRPNWSQRLSRSALCRGAGIPPNNLLTPSDYQQELNTLGFRQIELHDISREVIDGFIAWWASYFARFSAHRPAAQWRKYHLTVAALRWLRQRDLIRYYRIRATNELL